MTGRRRVVVASALLAGYVGVVVASYYLERDFWSTCNDDAYSDSVLTLLVSGPLLATVVAVAKFRPDWLWITAMIVALPAGYIICGSAISAASAGTPVLCAPFEP